MKKVGQLPNLDGMKSEVICQKAHKDAYTQVFLLTGCKINTFRIGMYRFIEIHDFENTA